MAIGSEDEIVRCVKMFHSVVVDDRRAKEISLFNGLTFGARLTAGQCATPYSWCRRSVRGEVQVLAISRSTIHVVERWVSIEFPYLCFDRQPQYSP